jgi:putative transposase
LELYRYSPDVGMLDEIRKATNGNYVFGDTLSSEQIAEALGRRVMQGDQNILLNKNNLMLFI